MGPALPSSAILHAISRSSPRADSRRLYNGPASCGNARFGRFSERHIMLKHLIVFASVICMPASLMAQTPAWQPAAGHTEIPIWPNGAPGAEPNARPEIDTTKSTDQL